MKKIAIKFIMSLAIGLSIAFLVTSCELDYKNSGVIDPEGVWSDPQMIKSYAVDMYSRLMPTWGSYFGKGEMSDEASNAKENMSDYLKGILDPTGNAASTFNYYEIDRINFFFEKIATVPTSVMADTEKNALIGEMKFWRASRYWDMVSLMGGVPLILNTQNVANKESLFLPRNLTSECVTQIIKDLDDAIAKLPATWTGANYGRIDKCAAAALKGKILMWYASPLFNPSNSSSRWQAAYDANKQAVDICKAAGKGLRPKYSEIWSVERNQEVIMVNQFFYPDHVYDAGALRPESISRTGMNTDMPYWPLMSSYTKKDGTPFTLDTGKAGTDVYDQQFLTDLYTKLDDRFYANIFLPGMVYPSKDYTEGTASSIGKSVWSTFFSNTAKPNYGDIMTRLQVAWTTWKVTTGFFCLKGNDPSLTGTTNDKATVDCIPFRYAEVLMDLGECANELGKTAEAVDVLEQIRQRAGIVAGSVKATSVTDIRELYIQERFAEFAFENKRFGDLRRWRRFDILNGHITKQAFKIVMKDNSTLGGNSGSSPVTFDFSSKMTDPAVRAKFNVLWVPNIDDRSDNVFKLNTSHYFYAIDDLDLSRNSKLEQNNDWGGTFDPLK